MLDAVIVGAGISGLATGFYLTQAGKQIMILEGSDRVGGLIRTEHRDGYTVEFGPNSLRGDSPELQEVIDGVGLRERIRTPALLKTRNYIGIGGRLVPVPRSPFELIGTPLLSASAKRYLLGEPFHKRGSAVEDESIASFFRRRAGAEAVEKLIKPLMSGIYAGDAEQLSIRSAFPKFFAYEQDHGSIVRGMLKAKKREKPTLPRMFSFTNGLTELPQALHAFMEQSIRLNSPVERIQKSGNTWSVGTLDGQSFEANHLVMTTPIEVSGRLLAEPLGTTLPNVYRPPISIVYLGFANVDLPAALDGFGFLVTPSEKADILGCIYTSALFPDRAPEGHVMLTVLMGGASRPDLCKLPESEIEARAIAALRTYMHIKAPPEFVSSHTWAHSIPQYDLGHHETISRLDSLESSNPGLHFAGNYRGGISIGNCITTAKSVAHSILGD
jgi:protoporphyrinogen/coproporphyrinogen III oxidase